MMKSLASVLIAFSLQFSSLLVFANNTDTVPQVHVQTNVGAFTLELYPKQAPETVANFLQYARDGFYEGVIFHRLIANYIAQAGAYEENLTKKPPIYKSVENEANNGLSNLRGTLAMAREADPHSGTSQFFINLADNNVLDYRTPTRRGWGYAVFGRIVAGEEILEIFDNTNIQRQGAFKYMPDTPIIIQSMSVDESSVAMADLPMVSKIEEESEETDVAEDEAMDTTDEVVADNADESYAEDDAAADESYAEDEAMDAAGDDMTDAEYAEAGTDEDYVEEDEQAMAEADAEVIEEEALTTAAAEPSQRSTAQPKSNTATAKPVVLPKNFATPPKSQVVVPAKHLPEPPDIPAVQ